MINDKYTNTKSRMIRTHFRTYQKRRIVFFGFYVCFMFIYLSFILKIMEHLDYIDTKLQISYKVIVDVNNTNEV